jgi:hypothetical protein
MCALFCVNSAWQTAGGMHLTTSSYTTVNGTSFTSNRVTNTRSDSQGGGAIAISASVINAFNCSFENNAAVQGIYFLPMSVPPFDLPEC